MSIAQFFQKLGIKSYHQNLDPQAGNMTPYYFRKPPLWACKYIDKKAARIKGSDIAFESSWGMAHYFYAMSTTISATFLVMIRDPISACNSLRVSRHNQYSNNIDELALLYNMTFLSLLWQSSIMVNQPRWMDFDKYVSGEYTGALFRLFAIEASATNMDIASNHLMEKVNSSGRYDFRWSNYFREGRLLIATLKGCIQEFGQ
jgi:hypothetical protein